MRVHFTTYVPILSTLQHVLEREDVLQYVLPERRARARENLEDFSDGAVLQNHPLFSSNLSALQIIGYYNELEICNPLGSAAKMHKLGIFLFTIANLPPKYRSSLKCIYLFAVAKASDVKKYTPDSIVAPFVADIKTLSSDGMTVSLRDKTLNFKGALLTFLADNLASHTIGGFKESFSKTFRFCRTCLATHDQAKQNFLSEAF